MVYACSLEEVQIVTERHEELVWMEGVQILLLQFFCPEWAFSGPVTRPLACCTLSVGELDEADLFSILLEFDELYDWVSMLW